MKTIGILTLAVLGVALGVGTGCRATKVNTVENVDKAGRTEMISDQRVLTDQTLNNIVRIVGVNVGTGDEGFLRIQVRVENLTSRARNFTYRVEWFDENGMIIEQPAGVARPRTIEAREVMAITATAPTPRANDFVIKFLEPTTR